METVSRWERVQRFDLRSGELEGHKETQIGGVVARANLTRTGVFLYRNADGSERRELRHPDEVFNPESLDSLAHATLTDDHPGSKVTTDSWRRDTIGHVAGRGKRSGQFVAGEIHVQHGPAAEKVKSGKLQEISCGYECQLDPTPGEWNGEHYDGIQRQIRYNHVALGPRGWGRAGSEVRLHLDSAALVSGSEPDEHGDGDSGDEPEDIREAMLRKRDEKYAKSIKGGEAYLLARSSSRTTLAGEGTETVNADEPDGDEPEGAREEMIKKKREKHAKDKAKRDEKRGR